MAVLEEEGGILRPVQDQLVGLQEITDNLLARQNAVEDQLSEIRARLVSLESRV